LLFKMGIFGDEKRKSEYAAAQLRRQQLELAQVALEQRVANEVMSALVVLDRSVAQVKRQQLIVDRQRESLKLESALVDSGRKSALDLMKRQLDVLMAEESLADSTVVANRASFIVSQSQGILLSRMGVE
jgi:outer membrane protein TolC